jgi:6,7-dimethyl-8-ribityllumazine synthase
MAIDQRAAAMIDEPDLDGSGLRIAVITARFNSAITLALLEGTRDAWRECRVDPSSVEEHWTPGSFELPVACKVAAESGRFDAVVAIGCVIRGETAHFDYVAGEAARGIQDVQVATGVPCIFGVLTTNTLEQAEARAVAGHDNKGREAGRTAVEMALLVRRLRANTTG